MRLIFAALCASFLAVGSLSLWLAMPDIAPSTSELGALIFIGSLIMALLFDQLSKFVARRSVDAEHEGQEFFQTVIALDCDRD